VVWPELASLAVDASVNYTITVLVPADFAGSQMINVANTTSDTFDNDLTNNGDEEPTPVDKITDLVSTKSQILF
jgi:hypothetical protein